MIRSWMRWWTAHWPTISTSRRRSSACLATRAIHGRANYKYLPTLTARTDDAIDPDAHASYFVAGFDANWEFGLFGRREGTRREAQGALDASMADLRIARVSLVGRGGA